MRIDDQLIPEALRGEFGLVTFPGKRFRVNRDYSYVDYSNDSHGNGDTRKVQLVLDVQGYGAGDADKVWRQFGRFNVLEVLAMAHALLPATTETETADTLAHAALIVAECERIYGRHERMGYAPDPCHVCGTEYKVVPATWEALRGLTTRQTHMMRSARKEAK